MKLFIPLILLLFAAPALAQTSAQQLLDSTHSNLNFGNPPNGAIRHCTNCRRQTGPCEAASVGESPIGADAVKLGGTWYCNARAAGAGSGDVSGPSASVAGELPLFNAPSGKVLGRSNTLSGVPLLSSGVVSTLGTTGSGDVVRAVSATLTTPALGTPTIVSFVNATHQHTAAAQGGQLNASNVFNGGTVPPARIISNSLTPNRCLRLSAAAQIETAANDCGAGGGGSPGGMSGNLTFNEAGSFGGIANSTYDAATGRLTLAQKANGNDTLNLSRATDTTPTGSLLRARNAANSTDLFRLDVDGVLVLTNAISSVNIAAPATPVAGTTVLWTDSATKTLKSQDDAGNVSGTVRAITCSGTDKLSAITAAGVPVCTPDQGGSGTGVLVLNGLNTSDQNFVVVDDTNIGIDISSATATHTITASWIGTLAKARQNAATVYTDQANTWTTGAQSFAAAASLTVPSAAGVAPTTSGLIAYDSTSNTWEAGVNGTNRIFAFTAGAQTFTDKTLDNSTTASLRDTLFTLQDNADPTKTVNFELSGITSGTNRVVTVANAASVTVQPTTATANQFVTHIDSAGVIQKAQPSFANLSGTMGPTQGGTGQTSTVQGDILYSDATNSWARLPKSTTATRYLSNTGPSNNPAWAQVDLTNGVTGLLPPANWSVLTTKGDLVVHNGTTSVRQAVGTNGFALLADSTQTNGVRWGAITASAGGSSTQLQYNSTGTLAGISGATTDGGAVTFAPATLIVGGQSATPTPVVGSFYRDTDDTKLYWAKDGLTWGEVFVAGLSVINLASANVTDTLPLVRGGTNQTSWTASRCVQVNAAGTALESAAAACGTGGGGTPGGSDTQVQFNDGGAFGGDSGMTYAKTTDTLTLAGALVLNGTGAGSIQLDEGTAPGVVADALIFAAPTDAPASGLLYILPSDTPTNGEQLTANISGTTVTLSWDAAGSGGSGDSVSVNSSATSDANFINTTASGTAPSITWSLNTGATPDEVSISAIGAASATEAGVITTGAQTLAGKKTFSPAGASSGLNVGSIAGDPSSPANGDIWYDSTANELTARINGVDVALGAGGGGGSGTINAGATNTIPKYIGSTTIDDSSLSDNGTTLTYTGSGGFALTATGGGYIQFTEGTGPAIVANTVQHAVAVDAPAAGVQYLWGSTAAASGVLRVANSSGVMTVTQDAGISHLSSSSSADLASVLSNETGTGAVVFGTTPTITFANTGLTIQDTDASHTLSIIPGENLTSSRTLTITVGDVSRSIDLSGGNLGLAGSLITSGGHQLTFTTTAITSVTLPTTGTLATNGDLSQFAATSSAQLRGVLSDESGTGAAVFAGGNIGAGSATTAAANDNSTLIATTAYVQGELTAYASDTVTFTNKTFDVEGTGNSFTSSHKVFLSAAGCQNTTAASFFDLPASGAPTAACVTGTNIQKGVLQYPDTGSFSAQNHFQLPADFSGTIDARVTWRTGATTGNTVWQLSTICTAVDATETDDPAWNTASTVTTAAPSVANRLQTSAVTSVTITGCGAGEIFHLRVLRDSAHASDTVGATVELVGVELTIRRAQ